MLQHNEVMDIPSKPTFVPCGHHLLCAFLLVFPFVCVFAFSHAMLAMLVCATRWLYMHLYTFAYMSMHESYLLVCRPCFNTYGHPIQTYICPSWTLPLFVYYLTLFPFLLTSWFLCLPCLSCLSALGLFIVLFASFPSMACLSVSCLCLCMYAHGVRTHGAKAQSLGRKQKGQGCEHVDMSQAAIVSRFRSLAFPFGYILF